MKNEKKLKLAEKIKLDKDERKRQEDKSLVEREALIDKQIDSIQKSILGLADALEVNVDLPDIKPLLEKLRSLEGLPGSFADIKNMSIAISGKLEKINGHLQKKQIISVRGFAEANKRFENIEKYTEKFADLRVYLEQLTQTLKQGQDPEDFRPVRLVVGGDGVPLKYLSQMPSSRGGGGQSNALTDDELRAAPVPVTESNPITGFATSAKQDTGNTSVANVDTNLGAKADASATTDTGTFSLISLFKRLLEKFTTLNAKDFATTAKQDTLLTELQLKADLTETQPVSAASLPLPTGASTSANQTTANSSLSSIDTKLSSSATETTLSTIEGKLPDFSGTWGYSAGTNGTVALTGSKRVLQITATALEAAGSFTINAGDTISLPYGGTDKVSTSLTIAPLANLTDPTIVFSAGIDSYFIEYVV